MHYFDYTATTPVDKEVLDSYLKATNNFFANTTSLHKLGQMSNYMYEVATNEIKQTLNVSNHNIIYTSNATEANNIAIMGICKKYQKGKIITTKIEHPSVFNTIKELEKEFDVVYLDIDSNGIIDLKQLEKEINSETILVSIMWVNNIIGTVQPIDEVIKIIKKYKKAHLHVDCVQGMCKVMPNFNLNDIDMFTISTHKIYGPKGIGALFVKRDISLKPILSGSSSQFGLKPGTFDVSLVVACAKAIKKFFPLTTKHSLEVREKFALIYQELKKNNNIIINTPLSNISYYILNISMPKMKGETIVHLLDDQEIYVSTGSSCSSKQNKIEKTVYELTKSEELALSTIRISLSHLTSDDDIHKLLDELMKI